MSALIQFKNVSFKYSEDGTWILKNCSFTIDEGEGTAIIGHNGSGKSTIAKLTNGLLFPTEGEIWVNGILLTEESVWDIRKEIGMVFQNPDNQFVGATVQDDVAFGMENRGIPTDVMKERIKTSLETVNMTDYLLTEPHRLSGGQKQRIAIAGIIAIKPKVMILDEATVMLDPVGRREMLETVNKLKRTEEVTFITITHDLNEIMQLDKVIVMNHGEVWQTASPQAILEKGAQLNEIGLALPFVKDLENELESQGIRFKQNPTTIAEVMEELWTFNSTR